MSDYHRSSGNFGDPQLELLDGGLRAWLTVVGVWLVQFCTFGYVISFPVYQDYYVRVYLTKSSPSRISWIGSMQVCLILTMGLFTGGAFDKGYFYHLMLSGIILFTFCLFMLSLTSPEQYYQVFLSDGLGLGIALGLTYVPSMGLISQYFQRHRTLALGVAATGSSMGGIVQPIMLNHFFNGSVGFRWGVRASASMNLGLLVFAMFFMRPRLPPRRPRNFISNMRAFARDPPYVMTTVGACLILPGIYIPMYFLQLDAVKHRIYPDLAFLLVTVMNVANLFGRIIPNIVALRFGVFNIIILSVALCGGVIFTMLASQTTSGTIAFAILFGFFSGGYISLFPPLVAILTEDLNEVGSRLGICVSFTGITGLVGIPIGGALLSSRFIWWRPVVFSGISVLLGAMALTVSRFILEARKGKRTLGSHDSEEVVAADVKNTSVPPTTST